MKVCLLLLAAFGISATGRAQNAALPPTTILTAGNLNFKQTMGFGQAELTTVGGEKSIVYILLSSLGFGQVVPIFHQEADIDKPGAQPLLISVDDIQMIYAVATGQYLEHMVIKGKRRHQLAIRVVDGPVELFSYTQVVQTPSGPAGFQAGPGGSAWYIRRQGELVEVLYGSFTKQMVAYFHDDPVIVEALANKKMRYNDMRMLVQTYNQHKALSGNPVK